MKIGSQNQKSYLDLERPLKAASEEATKGSKYRCEQAEDDGVDEEWAHADDWLKLQGPHHECQWSRGVVFPKLTSTMQPA